MKPELTTPKDLQKLFEKELEEFHINFINKNTPDTILGGEFKKTRIDVENDKITYFFVIYQGNRYSVHLTFYCGHLQPVFFLNIHDNEDDEEEVYSCSIKCLEELEQKALEGLRLATCTKE